MLLILGMCYLVGLHKFVLYCLTVGFPWGATVVWPGSLVECPTVEKLECTVLKDVILSL